MTDNILKSQSLLPRIDGIQKDVAKLRKLGQMNFGEFNQEPYYILAQFYLRQALEGVFHIGSHILARIPGGRTIEYKDIAKKLGEFGIVDKAYAETTLTNMAGYRNRLTHFYADVTIEEIYKISRENLGDIEQYLVFIKDVVEHPEKFSLALE